MYNDDIWGRSGPQSVITITETVKSKRLRMVDEIKRAIEIAEYIPFRYLIQHLGVGGEEYDERKLDAAFSALEELMLFARQRGVEILLENIPNELSSAERLIHFLGHDASGPELCLRRRATRTWARASSTEFDIMKDADPLHARAR